MKTSYLSKILFLLFVTSSSHAGMFSVCHTENRVEVPFKWCVTEDPNSLNKDVVYYLHGGGGNEEAWQGTQTWRAVEDLWKINGVMTPKIVTVSFGGMWLLTDVIQNGKPALLDYFVYRVVPIVETQIGHPPARLLLGSSMGGFNALQVISRYEYMFNRVALICPMLLPFGPYVDEPTYLDFIDRHQPYIRRDLLDSIIEFGRQEFPDEASWRANDPLVLIEKLGATSPSFFITSNNEDSMGFHEATDMLVSKMYQQLVPVELWNIPGDHCEMTEYSIERLSDFLAGVP